MPSTFVENNHWELLFPGLHHHDLYVTAVMIRFSDQGWILSRQDIGWLSVQDFGGRHD